MIRNERQRTLTMRKRAAAIEAANQIPDGDPGRDANLRFADQLAYELGEYEAVRGGWRRSFDVDSVEGLADALVRARIARGWTQKQLAEALHVSEQMVQKDESGGYENAGLARLADIADVLEYELHGELCPADTHAHPGIDR